jgi:four helix bundle protein
MGDFRKLRVWQLAKELAIKIYKLTQTPKLSKDFGLKDQMQRAAVSVSANIAEGDELDTNKQAVKHFYIAKGSLAELQTLLIIAQEIGYIDKKEADELDNECNVISVMLRKLISARSGE